MPGIEVSINKAAPPDNRSYKVDFACFGNSPQTISPKSIFPTTINELKMGLEEMNFHDTDFPKIQSNASKYVIWIAKE